MKQPGKTGEQESNGLRVAFFGGSFDPPHLGHLAVARAARAAFALDKVLFAPVGMQPLKTEGSAAGFEDRVAMTRLAIADEQGFEISFIDSPKSSDAPRAADGRKLAPNYTIDTLKNLRRSLAPGCTLYCLMGADSFLTLHHWHRAAEVPFAARLIVASRPGQALEGMKGMVPAGLTLEPAPEDDGNVSGVVVRAFVVVNAAGERAPFYVLPGLHVAISASQIRMGIRAQIEAGRGGAAAGCNLVPAAVAAYIARHKLYGS